MCIPKEKEVLGGGRSKGGEKVLKRELKETGSKVFPETTLARLSELARVRVAHVTRRDRDAGAMGGQIPAESTAKRESWRIYLKKKDEHPDSPGSVLSFSEDAADRELLVTVGERISQLAGAEFVDATRPG